MSYDHNNKLSKHGRARTRSLRLFVLLLISGIVLSLGVFWLWHSLYIAGLPVGMGYWHTDGGQIRDTNDKPVRMAGINWYGFETTSFVVHGLGQRNYKDMLHQMQALGYNTLRLPYSNQLFDAQSKPQGIDYKLNPDLKGLSGLRLLDKIVNAASESGLRIILDRHRPSASGQSALWYTDAYSESRWISDWKMLAQHYKRNPMVIGADLHNEPHSPACWNCGDVRYDWHLAAERAGNAILRVNPDLLIIVEGVECYSSGAGNTSCDTWGGNLQGVKSHPVLLQLANRVVYSPHEYGQSIADHPWFHVVNYPQNLPAVWDSYWGYIQKDNIAPVLVGEFGSTLYTESDRQWLTQLVSYLGTGAQGINWTYWCWNSDSQDTGGIMDTDWRSINQDKQHYLNKILYPLSRSIIQRR